MNLTLGKYSLSLKKGTMEGRKGDSAERKPTDRLVIMRGETRSEELALSLRRDRVGNA